MAIGYVTGLCYTQSNGKKRYDETNSFVVWNGTVIDSSINTIFATYNYLDQKIGSGGVGDKNTQYLRYWGPYDESAYTYIGTSNSISSWEYYAQPFIAGIGNKNASSEEEYYKEFSKWGKAFYFNFNKKASEVSLSRTVIIRYKAQINNGYSDNTTTAEDFGIEATLTASTGSGGYASGEINDFLTYQYDEYTRTITYSDNETKTLDDVISPHLHNDNPFGGIHFQIYYYGYHKHNYTNYLIYTTLRFNVGCYFSDIYNYQDGTHLDSALMEAIGFHQQNPIWTKQSENKFIALNGNVILSLDINTATIILEIKGVKSEDLQSIFASVEVCKLMIENKNNYGPEFVLDLVI